MSFSLPTAESLTVEFKSDRNRLSDRDLVEAVVCLANAEGGELWLGVEDDGRPTGLHAERSQLVGLSGIISARTSPSLTVTVSSVDLQGATVARIVVPKAQGEVATTNGVYVRRRIKADGQPECVAMLPHDRASRVTSFGLMDVSAQSVSGATLADLDPLERERLRQNVQQYGGDRVLLELDDEALDGALGLTVRGSDGNRLPTLTGLLLIGRELALRELVPTHEFAFQVLEREAVAFNEFRRFPLLKALDWLETNFRPYNPEREIQVGLFRVPVPKVDLGAFREAVANALVHRDYHRLGAVHVRIDDDGLTVSNPGGLVDGVTLANLLTTEPRPRNRSLADAMKRIGIVERSGRGVDKIYRGMLRFGRPEPDYRRTDTTNVVLKLATTDADVAFLKRVIEEENRRRAELPIDSLIALAALRDLKRLSTEELALHIQREPAQAKRTLEALVEAGLVQAHGTARGRTYTLAHGVYRADGDKAAYTRQMGFTNLQHEQMVLSYVRQHGSVRRSEVADLCRLTSDQAKDLLKRLKDTDQLLQHGERRAAYYVLGKAAGPA
ncbi:crosslink repair DNA glycosylase YcaQ family protein [Massilia sp. YIM B02763]|uniref:DNA glycosylase AlkZ-like family protein n=1 Tax=Massilia sp. YIM B02763 TaxID=3050130 RepID=UPI0025B674C1|nr:crosslink repair DNA glycosylase YcaQ family protein [Massilia sp. YIM B02763]MDN4053692.1 crosslink repair DNA glycosylase YcaQ family protein [Massilia sp. YIM B02763]